MKFRVVGTLGDGSEFNRVIDAPDQNTARSYAEKNGVRVASVSIDTAVPATQTPSSVQPKSNSSSTTSLLTKFPPFLIAMLLTTLAAPVIWIVLSFIFSWGRISNGKVIGDYVHLSSNRVIETEMVYVESFIYVGLFTVVVYCFLMVVFFICHLLYRSATSTKAQ